MAGRWRRAVLGAALAAWSLAGAPAFAQVGWSTPNDISAVWRETISREAPHVAADAAGNAIAVWRRLVDPTTAAVEWSRYDAATRTWSPARLLADPATFPGSSDPLIAMRPNGDAVVTWASGSNAIATVRHLAATAAWDAPRRTITPGLFVAQALAMNTSGLGLLLWSESDATGARAIRAQRFALATDTWGAARSPYGSLYADTPAVAVNASGDAVASWAGGGGTQVARNDAATDTWTASTTALAGSQVFVAAPVVLNDAGDAAVATDIQGAPYVARSAHGGSWTSAERLDAFTYTNAQAPGLAIDASGNVIAAWAHQFLDSPINIRVARFEAAGATWSTPAELSTAGDGFEAPVLGVDAAGNVFATWSARRPGGARLQVARWLAASRGWVASPDLTPTVFHSFGLRRAMAVDGRGGAVVVWCASNEPFVSVGGIAWDPTPPAPAIVGLASSTTTLTLNLYAGVASEPGLAVSTFEYSLDDGASWLARSPAGPSSPLTIGGLTDGVTYTLRVRSVNTAGPGAASVPLRVRSGTSTAPTGLRVAARSGTSMTFAWLAPDAGVLPDAYILEGGIAGTLQALASLPTGGAATQFTLAVPPGRFFVRIVPMSATSLGAGPSSSAVTIVTDGSAPPSMPEDVLGSLGGGSVAVSWRQALEQGALTATSLFLSGRALQSVTLPPVESVVGGRPVSAGVGVAVAAVNAAGASPYTSSVAIDFLPCAAPLAPRAFSASTQGGVVYLGWLPPSTGDAVLSYAVSVSGSFNGGFPATTRTLAVPAPSGTYSVRVASVGLCGTSAFTSAHTVVVP